MNVKAIMEIQIENFALEPVLKKFTELETEKISLGVKHRIKKIKSKLVEHYKAYSESHVELLKKHGAEELEDKSLKLEQEKITPEFEAEFKELAILQNGVVFDPIDFKKIEELETGNDYETLLFPFFENID